MSERRDDDRLQPVKNIGEEVALRERRKIRARRHKDRGIWFGLATFGMVGWSIAIPTLLGIILGLWIDARWPGRYSWTLMLFLLGLFIGCLSAWYWLRFESRLIQEEEYDEEADHE